MGRGGPKTLQDKVYDVIHQGVTQAVVDLQEMGYTVDEAETSKKVTRCISKNACNPDKIGGGSWKELCRKLVETSMASLQPSCAEEDWFFDLQLVPVFAQVVFTIAAEYGADPRMDWQWIEQEVSIHYGDKLERALIERALWEATAAWEGEPKVRSKIRGALTKAYWKALDEAITQGGRRIFEGRGDHRSDLQVVEVFTKKWVEDTVGRCWNLIENDENFSQETFIELFRGLLAPYGEENPFSCIPAEFTKTIGRPPQDWPYIPQVVNGLMKTWNNKNKRKASKVDEEPQLDDVDEPQDTGTRLPVNVFAKKRKLGAAPADIWAEEEPMEFDPEASPDDNWFDEAPAKEPASTVKPAKVKIKTAANTSALAGLFRPKLTGVVVKPPAREPRMPAAMMPKTAGLFA